MEWNVPDIVFARVSKLLACWPVGLASIDTPASPRCASQPFAVMTKATAVVMVGGALLSPALALAGEPYVGAGAGYSFADPHYVELAYDGGSISLGGPVTGKSYRLFVGYSFSPYVALEGGWFKADDLQGKIGPFSVSSTYTFVGGQRRITVSGASLDVVGTLPVNEHLSVLGRAGVLASKVTDGSWYESYVVTGSAAPSLATSSPYYEFQTIPRRANTFELGLGVQYKVSASWSFRSDWQRVNMSEYRMGYLDTLEIAAVYKF